MLIELFRLSISSWLSLVFCSFIGIGPCRLNWWHILLSFLSSENLWFPLHSRRIFLLYIRFMINSLFISVLEKCVPLTFGLDAFRWDIHRHSNWCSPEVIHHFSLLLSEFISLFLVFRSLIFTLRNLIMISLCLCYLDLLCQGVQD